MMIPIWIVWTVRLYWDAGMILSSKRVRIEDGQHYFHPQITVLDDHLDLRRLRLGPHHRIFEGGQTPPS